MEILSSLLWIRFCSDVNINEKVRRLCTTFNRGGSLCDCGPSARTFSIRSRHSPLSIQLMSTHSRPSLKVHKTLCHNRAAARRGNATSSRQCETEALVFQTLHLLVVFELLQRENVLVKIFLKLLVRIVDVELLKAVDLWRNGYFRTLSTIPS